MATLIHLDDPGVEVLDSKDFGFYADMYVRLQAGGAGSWSAKLRCVLSAALGFTTPDVEIDKVLSGAGDVNGSDSWELPTRTAYKVRRTTVSGLTQTVVIATAIEDPANLGNFYLQDSGAVYTTGLVDLQGRITGVTDTVSGAELDLDNVTIGGAAAAPDWTASGLGLAYSTGSGFCHASNQYAYSTFGQGLTLPVVRWRWSGWAGSTTVTTLVPGADVLQHGITGALFRAWRDGLTIKVDRSIDGGNTWPLSVTVATDPAGAATPTLTQDPWGGLFVWYHTAAGDAKCYRSTTLGAGWSLYTTVSGMTYPRALPMFGQQLLVGYTGGALKVHRCSDWWETPAACYTVSGAPEQLAALAYDRRMLAHLVYTDGSGRLCHQFGGNGAVWSTPDVWAAAGTNPGLALDTFGGLVSYWASGSLVVKKLSPAYDAVIGAAGTPAGAFRGWQGMAGDGRGGIFLAGVLSDGTLAQLYSGNGGGTWG